MDEKFALLKITPVGEDGEPGEPIPIGYGNIAQYKGRLVDIDGDGSGTTENGYTIRDIRRRGKAVLTVRFEGLTTPKFKALMSAVSHDEFTLTYFIGEYKTITVHAGDKNFELVKAKNEAVGLWRLDVNFIEY